MHHIFYVQSGISVAIAKKAIEQLELEPEKCIFLTGRALEVKGDIRVKDTNEWTFRTSALFFKGWIKSYQSKKSIKRFLERNQIKKFNIYTTSFAHWFYYVLSVDKRCNEVWALEEGRASFYTEQEFREYVKRFHYSSPKYLAYQIKSWLNHFFLHYPNPNKTISLLKKHNKALVTSLKSYQYIEQRIVIENPFYDSSVDYSDVKCLMALSYPVEDGLISIDNFELALRESLDKLILKGERRIHYKFHPQQLTNPKYLERYQSILEEYAEQIEFIELPKSAILEVVVQNSETAVLSDYSSLMIYSDTFGNKIYANFSILEKYDPSIKTRLAVLPQILLDLMDKNKLD